MQQGAPAGDATSSKYRGAQGLDPAFIKQLEKQFGFDKPAYERFGLMLWNYARFDFGRSYFRDISVLDLIKEKMPVSISLGLWMMFISYGISILLGIAQGGARRLALRCLDLGGHYRRLCDTGLPVRHPAHHPVRRRLLLPDLPAARPHLGQLGPARLVGKALDYFWHLDPAHHLHGAGRLRHHRRCSPRTRSSTKSASSMWSPRG